MSLKNTHYFDIISNYNVTVIVYREKVHSFYITFYSITCIKL